MRTADGNNSYSKRGAPIRLGSVRGERTRYMSEHREGEVRDVPARSSYICRCVGFGSLWSSNKWDGILDEFGEKIAG